MEIEKIGFDELQNKDIFKLKFEASELPSAQLFNTVDVLIGNPSSNITVAFIYSWASDRPPEEIRRLFQRLSTYAYMTGLWKTTNGARYVFANILANPNVNKLVVFTFGVRDNGHLLVDAIRSYWKKGTDKKGTIIDCKAPNPRFEQVPEEVGERIRQQVDLVIVNIKDLERAEEIVKQLYQEPDNAILPYEDIEFISQSQEYLYDDGARFAEPYKLDLSASAKKVEFIQKYSSLPLGQSVYAEDLQEALEMVTAFVYEKGAMFRDQRGVITMESRSFSVTITDPIKKIPKGFSKEYIEKYVAEFMHGKGKLDEFAYTYHHRVFKKWGNQVNRAISVLKANNNTRRCIISLWDPTSDLENSSPPCLDFIWFVIREKKLEMHVVYRSHHLATVTKEGKLMKGEGAFVPNLYALGKLQDYVSKKIKIKRGPLALTDFSGHLYMSDV